MSAYNPATQMSIPGISEHDNKIITEVKRKAYRLDMQFSCCRIRFGSSSVCGAVPVAGGVVNAIRSARLIRMCKKVEGGLPAGVQVQMIFNIILDFGIGLVPVFGNALFRANTINAVVLEKYLSNKGANAPEEGRALPPPHYYTMVDESHMRKDRRLLDNI